MQDGVFVQAYEDYADRVFNHLLRRTASIVDAEDLTAIVFLEAWRLRDRPFTRELPGLLGIANNVLRNHRRSQRRFAAAVLHFHVALSDVDPADAIIERVDAVARVARLRPQLDRLPRRQLEVLEMCAGSGLSVEAAAAALHVPVGTVKSRLAPALASMRDTEPVGWPINNANEERRAQESDGDTVSR